MGEMHYSDFLAAMACDRIALDDDLLFTTFQKFDTRGAGYIHAHDFHSVLGASLEGGHADALVREADIIDRDGHIVYEEFAEYIRSRRKQLKEDAATAVSCSYLKVPASAGVVPSCASASSLVAAPPHAPTLLESHRGQAACRSAQKAPKVRTVDAEDSIFRKLEAQDSCCSQM